MIAACGYFLFDLYVLVRWKVPLWRVFVIHHIVAAYVYLSIAHTTYPLRMHVSAYLLRISLSCAYYA